MAGKIWKIFREYLYNAYKPLFGVEQNPQLFDDHKGFTTHITRLYEKMITYKLWIPVTTNHCQYPSCSPSYRRSLQNRKLMEHIRELEAEIDQLQSQLEAETEKLKGEGDTQGKVMHV